MSAAATPMNGSASASSKPSSSPSNAASNSKPQLKTTASGKVLDGQRKQASSPVDAQQNKKPPPKAWQGPNPITQRAAGATTPNGVQNGPAKNNTPPAKQPQQQPSRNLSDKHAHDRTLFLVTNFIGMNGRITLSNGEKFEGIFSGASLDTADARFTMKMVKRTAPASNSQSNGSPEKLNEYIGDGETHTMTFDLQDTVDLNVWDVQLAASEGKPQNGVPSFRTDAEISGIKNVRERELQPWQPGPDTNVDLSLDASSVGTWDQFAANEKLYNVRSDYDENLYTTSIDRSNPRYKQLEAEARKIAGEIERSEPVNSHVAEERRMNAKPDAGIDEEDKYSGVRRDYAPLSRGQSSAYVPPSRRPITSQPTVPGAPFDPAIIMSQIARPALNSTSTSDAPKPAQNSQDTDDASKAVAAAQQTSESKPDAPSSTPAITVAPAGPQASAAKPAPSLGARRPGEAGTEGVERRVLDSFKQFSNTEKLKYQQHQRAVQERSRVSVRQEKSVKLNDLKKFAENFKLYSRVPDDLVPILAKTKEKQEEIVSKAEQQARDKELKVKTDSPATPASLTKPDVEKSESKAAHAITSSGKIDAANDLTGKQRAQQPFRGPAQPVASPRGPAMANQRIPPTQPQQHKPGMTHPNAPGPMQMPNLQTAPSAPAQARESGMISPSSAASSRFNVKAMEFRPNPGASAFTPGGAKVSPEASKRPSVAAPSTTPVQFATDLKPPSERASFGSAFNPIKRMSEKIVEDGRTKDFAANGGIPQAFKTPPVWEHPKANDDVSYADAFQKSLASTISPMHTPSNGGMPYQNQLPIPLQNATPQIPSAQATPRFFASQPHGIPNQHMEDQRMQYASGNSSVQPSPRMGNPAMAYQGQMHPQMPNYPGGMPGYGMSPGMPMRPMPAGPQFGNPQGPPMGGQMMVQQPSNGPYMNGPMGQHMPMYPSPAPANVQPHFGGNPQQAGMNAPYGGPHAHPMRHQGSQQGHAMPAMYMMPQGGPGGPMVMPQHPGQMQQMRGGFPQQQYQPGPYPMQHRAMSNGGYNNHMTPRQHHAVPQQGPSPGNAPPMHGSAPGDEGK